MNKKGWGLRVELAFLLLFLVCLLLATIFLQKLDIFGSGDKDFGSFETSKYDYTILENKVSSSAKMYYENVYPNGSNDTVIVSVETLKNSGYLSDLSDNLNRDCKGYAKILSNGNCVSYIRCPFYKTTGYSEDYE